MFESRHFLRQRYLLKHLILEDILTKLSTQKIMSFPIIPCRRALLVLVKFSIKPATILTISVYSASEMRREKHFIVFSTSSSCGGPAQRYGEKFERGCTTKSCKASPIQRHQNTFRIPRVDGEVAFCDHKLCRSKFQM